MGRARKRLRAKERAEYEEREHMNREEDRVRADEKKMDRQEEQEREHRKNMEMAKKSMSAAMSPALYSGYKKQGPPTSAATKKETPAASAQKKGADKKKLASMHAVEKSLSKRLEPYVPLWIFLLVVCGCCCLGCVAYSMRDQKIYDEFGSKQ